MGQPSTPATLPPSSRPPTPCQVRCAGCRMILAVAPGFLEFICPNCRLPQMLPPELLKNLRPQQPPPPPPQVSAHGIDPNKLQLPCVNCKALLNVPHGLSRFKCPQCEVDLALDLSKFDRLRLPVPPELNQVAPEVEQEEDEGDTLGETFTDYCPAKVSADPPHPDPIVETSLLSAVQPPEPTYSLAIMDEIESSKALSCLQLETLVYACQRHLLHLQDGSRAGFLIGDGAGVGKGRTIAGLIWENWKHGRRKALWVSVGSDLKIDARRDLDDVGATFVEVHPLNRLPYEELDLNSIGIREGVLFLTYSSLIASSETGHSRLNQLVKWCGSQFDGLIIFDEYHKVKNLIREAGSPSARPGELVQELQEKLPEARVVYCSVTGASKPQNLGFMVRLGLWGSGTSFRNFWEFLAALENGGAGAVELVAMDMKARGMFVCRTLSYKGVNFEVVEASLDAKMMGIYNKAAEIWAELRVEFLSAIATYHKDKPASSFSQLWQLYWASHQQFFRQLCMSAKVLTVVKLAKQALLENKCVVIGLQNTGGGLEFVDFVSGPQQLLLNLVESHYPLPEVPEPVADDQTGEELPQKRRSTSPDGPLKERAKKVAKLKSDSNEECDERSESDVDDESTDSDDEYWCGTCCREEDKSKLLKCTCCGQLVHPSCLEPPIADVSEEWTCNPCKQKIEDYLEAHRSYIEIIMRRYKGAVERKEKILEIIRSLDLPKNPLDDIIDQLGGPDNVAEMTERWGRLVRASCGEAVSYQARNTKDVTLEMVNMHEKQLFMDGKKFIAIISEAVSGGISLQVDRKATNQRRRVYLTLELPWSTDKAIQQFGRIHRSNQASAPEYRLIFTNLGGEQRLASVLVKRLESLGALTQGHFRTGPSPIAFDYDSVYGKRALLAMYRGITEQDPLPVMPPGCSENSKSMQDFIAKAKAALVSVGIVGEPGSGECGKGSGHVINSDMNDVVCFLSRLLGLPPEIQNTIFELLISIYDVMIRNVRTEGNFGSGIVDIRANTVEIQGKPKTVHVDHMSGASTVLSTFILDRGTPWELASALHNEKQKGGLGSADGFYESQTEWLGRRHLLLALERPTTGMLKIVRPALGEATREMPLAELRDKYRMITSLEKAHSGWEDEYEVSSRQCMHGPKCKVGSYCTVGRRLQEVNVLVGPILPIWKAIERALSKQAGHSHRQIRAVRIETTSADRQQIVGLLIPNATLEDMLQDLDVGKG